jgi:hypothetical protein
VEAALGNVVENTLPFGPVQVSVIPHRLGMDREHPHASSAFVDGDERAGLECAAGTRGNNGKPYESCM